MAMGRPTPFKWQHG